MHIQGHSLMCCRLQVSGLADGMRVLLREGYSMTAPPEHSTFEFGQECQTRLSKILQSFEGCHNFHNFSPGVTPEQMSAQRCALVCRALSDGGCAVTFVLNRCPPLMRHQLHSHV